MVNNSVKRGIVRRSQPTPHADPASPTGAHELDGLLANVRQGLPNAGRAPARAGLVCRCRLERPTGESIQVLGTLDREGLVLSEPFPLADGAPWVATIGWGGRGGLVVAVVRFQLAAPASAPYAAFERVLFGLWELERALETVGLSAPVSHDQALAVAPSADAEMVADRPTHGC